LARRVDGERALAWVREKNAASTSDFEGTEGFAGLRRRLLGSTNPMSVFPASPSTANIL
jgi:hypothetical protein